MRAFLSQFVDRGCPVIPVLLESAPKQPELPLSSHPLLVQLVLLSYEHIL